MDSGLVLIAMALAVLIIYLTGVWFLRNWLINRQVSCFWRSLILAVLLAPGLLLYGEHAGIPLPAFAWMSAASNTYNCVQQSLFCSVKLNLFIAVLPFLATWMFAYMMCKGPATEQN